MYLHISDSSYAWQSAIVVDHDYVGSFETSTAKSQDTFPTKGTPTPPPDDAVLKKDHVFPECKSSAPPEYTSPDSAELVTMNPDHWPAPYWTLQNKMAVT